MKVKSESEVAQSCPTLSDPMDCSLSGFSAHGIFQARVLEWVAIAFSDQTQMDLMAPFLAEPEASEVNCELLRFLWTDWICPVMEPLDSTPRLHWAHHCSCSHWQRVLTRQGTGGQQVGVLPKCLAPQGLQAQPWRAETGGQKPAHCLPPGWPACLPAADRAPCLIPPLVIIWDKETSLAGVPKPQWGLRTQGDQCTFLLQVPICP